MPSPREQTSPTLSITISTRGCVLDEQAREYADRSLRFATARFGANVRSARFTFTRTATGMHSCAIRLGLVGPKRVAVVQHADTLERALQDALEHVTFAIARELHTRSQQSIARRA
jgi:hypothetical protein